MAMEINNNRGNGTFKGLAMQTWNTDMDSVSKNIQRQIANKKKQMQELSKSEDMSAEDKMKRRQEIQKEIADLNNQLRQHQIEQRREQQTKKSSMNDMLGGSNQVSKKSSKSGTGMSSASMQAIISADVSMGQVKMQSSVKTEMKGKAAVLKSEIQRDKGRGASTETKEAELADVEGKIDSVTSSQMNALSDINKKLAEAAKEDSKTKKTDEKKDKKGVDQKDTEKNGELISSETVVNTNLDTTESQYANVENLLGQSDVSEQAVIHVDIRI